MGYFATEDLHIKGHDYVTNIEMADVFIVLGGDGSIIEAVSFLTRNKLFNVPVLGVNTGHVGFLSNDIKLDRVKSILDGEVEEWPHYHISKRRLISVRSKLQEVFGINEVVIGPQVFGRLLTTDIIVDDVPLTYQGDGLVISTSSGSTAYNLSAGGPIVTPAVEGMCITPLNPFALASRTLVVPSNTTIKVMSNKESSTIIDGQPTGMYDLVVTLSEVCISLIKVNSFMSDIQHKLGWNKNIKN